MIHIVSTENVGDVYTSLKLRFLYNIHNLKASWIFPRLEEDLCMDEQKSSNANPGIFLPGIDIC